MLSGILFGGAVTKALQELLNEFFKAIPNFVAAVTVAIIGYIISKIVAKLIKTFLTKIKIDKLGEKLNEIELISKANIEIKLSEVFSKIVYYFLLLFFMVASAELLGMPAVSQLVMDIFQFIPNLIVAVLVLIIGILVAEMMKGIVHTALKSLGIGSAKIIANILFYFLFINIVILALTQAKINTNFLAQNLSIIIGGAVLAFAIGYGSASKDVVANFLASFYSKDKFKIGDTVTIDDETGEIITIDKASITLLAKDKKVIIPLSKITSEKIIIHSKK
jgi:small-conductance mechanosensitive channel